MKNAVIATTTCYKDLDEARAKLALKTIKKAVKLGYPIIVADDSPDFVKNAFLEAGAIVLNEEEKGMGRGRRQAIKEAVSLTGPDGAIIWMEPEKTPFIPFLDRLLKYFFNEGIELLIPGRKSLSSYPESQQKAEWLGNRTFALLTGKNLDVWFGPRIFLPSIAPYFLDYRGEYGDRWDSIFIPILRAMKDEAKVEGMLINFIYPKEQREEEKESLVIHMKRIEQLVRLVDALRNESYKLNLRKEA